MTNPSPNPTPENRSVAQPIGSNRDYQKHAGTYGRCAQCHAQWSGLAVCHCSACHHTFTGLTAFDKHRAGSHAHGTRHCLHPATVGLIEVTKTYWKGWANPGDNPRRDDNP